jgi:hypothetical protein
VAGDFVPFVNLARTHIFLMLSLPEKEFSHKFTKHTKSRPRLTLWQLRDFAGVEIVYAAGDAQFMLFNHLPQYGPLL